MQHWLGVYSPGFQSPRSFAGVDCPNHHQFADGRSISSTTNTCAGAFTASSFSPASPPTQTRSSLLRRRDPMLLPPHYPAGRPSRPLHAQPQPSGPPSRDRAPPRSAPSAPSGPLPAGCPCRRPILCITWVSMSADPSVITPLPSIRAVCDCSSIPCTKTPRVPISSLVAPCRVFGASTARDTRAGPSGRSSFSSPGFSSASSSIPGRAGESFSFAPSFATTSTYTGCSRGWAQVLAKHVGRSFSPLSCCLPRRCSSRDLSNLTYWACGHGLIAKALARALCGRRICCTTLFSLSQAAVCFGGR
jgi:hypothetical protein